MFRAESPWRVLGARPPAATPHLICPFSFPAKEAKKRSINVQSFLLPGDSRVIKFWLKRYKKRSVRAVLLKLYCVFKAPEDLVKMQNLDQ